MPTLQEVTASELNAGRTLGSCHHHPTNPNEVLQMWYAFSVSGFHLKPCPSVRSSQTHGDAGLRSETLAA